MAGGSSRIGSTEDAPVEDATDMEDIVVTPDDCNVYENIAGTKWGATAAAASAAATAAANQVFRALKVRCPDADCPVTKKDKSVGKPRVNQIVIDLPMVGAPIVISLGFVCDYEIIYGCFRQSASEPA
jgi:hypothetical protein